jgi:2-dehydropantoate 2-reductase
VEIGIIGAGSIGLLFAAYISKVVNVTLYTRTMEQANEINKFGIVLQKSSQQTISFVKALPFTDWHGVEDLTIITVKQYQLNPIVKKINELPINPKNLLFLQNGMGHLKLLEQLPVENIFVGSVEHGALKVNSITVSHNGEGTTNVAVFKGDSTAIQHLAALLPPEFSLFFNVDFYEMLLNKLIINAVINPLTAILQVENGDLIDNRFYFHASKKLFTEISSILNLDKPDEHFKQIVEICNKTAGNRSSMLRDLEEKRMTEVDAILGFLLEEANSKEMKAPQVESLYYLLKGKEIAWGAFF